MLATACGTGTPSSSAIPGASAPSATRNCSSISVLTPSGARVQLTGVWRGNDQGVYDILQRESCINWLGMSQDVGFGAGDIWTNVFIGTVNSDFTISGRWGDVPFNPAISSDQLGIGSLLLHIDFDRSTGVERPVLRTVEQTGFFGGTVWVQQESLPAATDLDGLFGGIEDQACVWVEANGERVELVGSGQWVYRDPPLSVQDASGHIAARVGDPIRVHGRLAPMLGSGCADSAILVDALDPIP